jgi:hypothetical protein
MLQHMNSHNFMRGLHNYGTRMREAENFVSDSPNILSWCSIAARVLTNWTKQPHRIVDKLTVPQPFKRFTASYHTWMIITLFTKAHYLLLSRHQWTQSTQPTTHFSTIHFWGRLQAPLKFGASFRPSECLSVSLYVSARLQLNGFPYSLILGTFTTIYQENPNFVEISHFTWRPKCVLLYWRH